MKDKVPEELERCRITKGLMSSNAECGFNGAFFVPFKGNKPILGVVSSDQMGWDHVSVSLPSRSPSWSEMCYIKDLFFKPGETVIQFHPDKSQYVNFHPHCLHLWKKQGQEYELPPTDMIGPR